MIPRMPPFWQKPVISSLSKVVEFDHFKYGEIATIKNQKYGTKNKRLERCEVQSL